MGVGCNSFRNKLQHTYRHHYYQGKAWSVCVRRVPFENELQYAQVLLGARVVTRWELGKLWSSRCKLPQPSVSTLLNLVESLCECVCVCRSSKVCRPKDTRDIAPVNRNVTLKIVSFRALFLLAHVGQMHSFRNGNGQGYVGMVFRKYKTCKDSIAERLEWYWNGVIKEKKIHLSAMSEMKSIIQQKVYFRVNNLWFPTKNFWGI